MDGFSEVVLAAGEFYEAAKAIKEGATTAWNDLSSAYSYIASYFGGSIPGKGSYNNIVSDVKWAECWVLPVDVRRLVAHALSMDMTQRVQRVEFFNLLNTLQKATPWIYHMRFPDRVCLPLYGEDYAVAFSNIYLYFTRIHKCYTTGSFEGFAVAMEFYSNNLTLFNRKFTSGVSFYNRSSFETTYKLTWKLS